jgi:hypothetical protein
MIEQAAQFLPQFLLSFGGFFWVRNTKRFRMTVEIVKGDF